MQKGTTVVYTGGADGGNFTVGSTYTVIDYSDWRSQVKVKDDDGDTIWISDACVKEV